MQLLELQPDDLIVYDVLPDLMPGKEQKAPNRIDTGGEVRIGYFNNRLAFSYIKDDVDFYDAVLVSAEGGSALTLLHPEFSVVVPRPGTFSVPQFLFFMHKCSK